MAREDTSSYCCGNSPCTDYVPGKIQWTVLGRASDRCPRDMVTELSRELLRWHKLFRRGFLPVSGGLMDQSAFYVDAMTFIEGL